MHFFNRTIPQITIFPQIKNFGEYETKTQKNNTDPSTMRSMLHDQYANYVVQCALLVSNDEQGMRLVASIRPHINDLSVINQSCARRVAGRVLKRFARLSTDPVFSAFV
jgi:hypothetical protein